MKKRLLSLALCLALCLGLLPVGVLATGGESGGIYVAPGSPTEGGGGTYIPGEDTRTEIWCVMKPSSIQRSYDGTTDGSTIPIDLTFTDGTNEIKLKERTGFTAKKTFDSADAGRRTVTVEIELIGDAAAKYKLKAGEETFTIGGYIDKAHPDLTVSLSRATCAVGEKLLPLLSVSGVKEDAAVTYYYTQYKTIAGDSEYEGIEAMPEIDENTAISEPGTYYVYAKTGETKNYEEERSTTVELTVSNDVASVTTSDGVTNNYTSLDDALNAAQNGDTVTLLSDVDLGETYVTINKSITFDLGGKTLSSSKTYSSDGVLLVKDATVTVKNGKVKAAEMGSCAIRAYGSGASMTLEDVTATVTSDESSVMVGDFGSAVIKSGDYQGLYVGIKSQVTLEGGTFRPYMDNITNKNVKSIFWKVNETTDITSCDCMELLEDGCVYLDESGNQVRTGGGFNTVVTVQKGTPIDTPVAKIGDVGYTSLSKAINAVQNGGTITLLNDLDLGNGAVLQVGSPRKNFTIDLASHTLSADGDCLIMLHNGSQLTLKNGTLDGSRCTSYEGVLYISSNSGPKLTLENVTAKNVQRSVPLVYVTNGTVEFDGGSYTGGVLVHSNGNAVLKNGTFQKGNNSYSIKTEVEGKHLSDYLDEGSLSWKGNERLDLSSITETADTVTVLPCNHNWQDGKCTICQKVCDHGSADGKSMTEDPCPTCGMKAAAQVDITGSDAKYFPSFNDALVYATNNNGCTLKLLANVTDPVSINTPFIFDLNGHNFNMLSVGARAKIRDSSTTKGTIKELKVFNMTVADLLEEGYAFKSSSENKWYFGVENAITNVTVQPAPIKSVTAEHPTVTVEYGKTSGVTLTATAVPATEGGTVSYQWYKTGGTDFPIQDATENTYQLPADLGAGMHTYRLTATSDGYPKSVDITVKVTPISLEGAEVTVKDLTYNGEKQLPMVTVTLDGKTLKNTDFDVDATMQTNAGSYTLTISGNGNYSGEIKDVEWKIEPLPISLLSVSSISKSYDGSADVTLTADKLTFFSKTASRSDIQLPITALSFSEAKFTKQQADGSYLPSPEVGSGKALSYTMTLTSNNYVFEGKSEGTTEVSDVFATDDVNRFTITKAAAPTDIQTGTLNVVNGTKLEYTYDAKQLLPKAPKGTYGKVSYNCEFPFNLKNGYYVDDIAIKDNILTLTIDALNGGETGKIGTIPVYVTTDNYASFNLPLDLYAVNKITPVADGEITAAGITYGDALSKSTISGKMKDPNTGATVNGTFAWTDGTTKPAANDSYEAKWTFTPAAGYEKYATATGTVTIKVNKATPTFTAPTAQENLTYTGQEQALITAGSVMDYGTMQYSLTENGTYSQNIPAGTDAGAYTVWYRVIGDANHNDTAPASVAVRIGQKPLTITGVTAASKPYDGTTDAGITSVTFDGVNLNRGTDYTVTASFDDASAGNVKNITATVTLMDQAAKNYALEQSNFSATGSITKAAPTYTPPTANDLTYNGTAQELFKAGTTQDGTMLYSMSKTSDFLPNVPLIRKAGTYTFYYQVRGDGNHTDSDIGTITVTIKKAPLTITAKDKSAYVGSTAPDLSNPELNKDYTVSGLFGRDLLTKSPVLSYATEKPDMSQVGSVDINISDADAGRNYTITYVSGKLNITTRPSSSGSSNSGTKTDTVKNPDGSTTKTETKADGSKTETTTASSGGGSTGTTVTKTDAKGNTTTEASAKLSDRDVKEAQEKGEAVTVPVKEIKAAKDANAAAKIKIDVPSNANKTTVEIPVENVTSGTVAVIVHEDGTEELVKDSKPTEHGVQLELSGSTTVKIIDNSKTFDDTKDHWSRDEVNFVAARELFNGVGGNQFGVSQPMTRGMVNTVLARLAGVDTTPSQGQAWYEVGTDWAKKNGISDGTNPTAPVTREQLATLLYRYAGSPSVSGTLHAADAASVSDYAEDALLWANQNGIVNGVGSNTIAPKDNAQRAQVAAMLARYLQNQ